MVMWNIVAVLVNALTVTVYFWFARHALTTSNAIRADESSL